MRENPAPILLTNYMMLELLLTRVQDRSIRSAIYENLRFLVLTNFTRTVDAKVRTSPC
jgi:ATP-dependent helicase YprA (DUF1998 family)